MNHSKSFCSNETYLVLPAQSEYVLGQSNMVGIASEVDPYRANPLQKHPDQVDQSIRGTSQWYNLNRALVPIVPDTSEGHNASTEQNPRSELGMCLDDRPWPATQNCDAGPAVPYQYPWPYNPHVMSDSMSMPCWTANEYMFSQVSSPHSTPVPFQPDPIMMQDMSLPDTDIHPSTSHLSDHLYPSNTVYTKQNQSQASSPVITHVEAEDAVARIGSLLSNGKFVCDDEACGGRTFARQAELNRHYMTLHATNKPNFWCHVPTCRRSMSEGGRAFHRKDKLVAHVRSRHAL